MSENPTREELEALETKLAWLERLLQKLNEATVDQEQRIEKLERTLKDALAGDKD
ncbi:MAG: SlyX family protein [Calditrichaeota bacterium]|nr:SlyX family protein [Candidatus Cloacimonadota bacterium]MCA9787211.1 SlyX family protein [Candidatus Cloacimonadota bacterium]MCB1048227.1 SlyX family protein [Calditrichota bacterium]MCB9474294.1 SlyX family protein [Candidatus Delongbacteria bacterium]